MTRILGYELRKILRRPFTLVVLIGCAVILIFISFYTASQSFTYAWGPDVYGSYENIPAEKLRQAHEDYELTDEYDGTVILTGREAIDQTREITAPFEGVWDNERLQQMVFEYQNFMNDPDIYTDQVDEFAMQMRRWTFEEQNMSTAEMDAFDKANPIYIMKPEHDFGEMRAWRTINDTLDEFVINPDGSTKTFEEAFPLLGSSAVFASHQGPQAAVQFQGILVGLFTLVLLLAGVSPLFSDEVACRTEPMLLAAKFGRDKLIRAKILSGLIFAAGGLLLLTLLNFLFTGIAFGFDGYESMIQFELGTSSVIFPLSFGQYLLAVLGFQLLGVAAFSSLLMVLSGVMRSAFPVVFAGGVFAVVVLIFANNNGLGIVRLITQLLPPSLAAPFGLFIEESGLFFIPNWIPAIIVSAAILVLAILYIRNKYRRPQNV